MKVLSFNARIDLQSDGQNQFSNRLAGIVTFIHEQKPDIIGFQEVNSAMLKALLHHLNDYLHIGEPRSENGEYNPIFYLKSYTLIYNETKWYAGQKNAIQASAEFPRIYTIGTFTSSQNNTFTITNTHFSHISDEAKIDSINTLTSLIKNHYMNTPFILTGDFNTWPSNQFIKPLSNLLKNCWDSSTTLNQRTFHGFKNNDQKEPIDYIFVSKMLNMSNITIHHDCPNNIYLSDHYPISVDINF